MRHKTAENQMRNINFYLMTTVIAIKFTTDQGLGNVIQTNNSKRKFPTTLFPYFFPFLHTSLQLHKKFYANSTPTKYLIFGNFK